MKAGIANILPILDIVSISRCSEHGQFDCAKFEIMWSIGFPQISIETLGKSCREQLCSLVMARFVADCSGGWWVERQSA